MSHLSYPEQTEVDYCIECAVKHSQTSKVLIGEGLQRAEADGPASSGVTEKIRGVVEELSGMEDDTSTKTGNENVETLNKAARMLRKHVYTSKAGIGGATLEDLRKIKAAVDGLVNLSYKAREAEAVCVSCVSPAVCKSNKGECVAFLEEAAKGDKQRFEMAVEKAKEKYGGEPSPTEEFSEFGVEAARKRKSFLEELKAESAG